MRDSFDGNTYPTGEEDLFSPEEVTEYLTPEEAQFEHEQQKKLKALQRKLAKKKGR